MNHLKSLQEIHSISSEIQNRRARLREVIRNADDTLLDVIADSLLKVSSTPVETEKVTKKKPGPKTKSTTHELGAENVRSLILRVMGKKPISAPEILQRFKEQKIRLNSDNPRVYITWVLAEHCNGKNACFTRVGRGKYVPRKSGAKTTTTTTKKMVLGEVPTYMKQDWVQKVFVSIHEGEPIFSTPELAHRTKLNGQKFASLFSQLREMRVLKRVGDSKWKLVDRATLHGLMTPKAAAKANGHDSKPSLESHAPAN